MKFKSKLHFVRIFFDTSTFDKVTMESIQFFNKNAVGRMIPLKVNYLQNSIQDEKAKTVDKLSAIGGTLGLLTGFSIISAVEVLFFILKIAANFLQQQLNWKIKL